MNVRLSDRIRTLGECCTAIMASLKAKASATKGEETKSEWVEPSMNIPRCDSSSTQPNPAAEDS